MPTEGQRPSSPPGINRYPRNPRFLPSDPQIPRHPPQPDATGAASGTPRTPQPPATHRYPPHSLSPHDSTVNPHQPAPQPVQPDATGTASDDCGPRPTATRNPRFPSTGTTSDPQIPRHPPQPGTTGTISDTPATIPVQEHGTRAISLAAFRCDTPISICMSHGS